MKRATGPGVFSSSFLVVAASGLGRRRWRTGALLDGDFSPLRLSPLWRGALMDSLLLCASTSGLARRRWSRDQVEA